MAKTLGTMKTNVGNMVQDSSASMATLIEEWINDRLLDISRRIPWSALVDDNYTFTALTGTNMYLLPTRFDREIFAANITDGIYLQRYNEGNWWEDRYSAYVGSTITKGTTKRYKVLRESGTVYLDPAPYYTFTVAMPYKLTVLELSSTANTPTLLDIENIIECGAVADAFAYLGKFQKSDYYAQKYEYELTKRIGQEKSQFNQLHQVISANYKLAPVYRFSGETSYDTIP